MDQNVSCLLFYRHTNIMKVSNRTTENIYPSPPRPYWFLYTLSMKEEIRDRSEQMHEYFTEYPPNLYRKCADCNKRTPHICLKCNFCFSCHYKVERIEKSEKVRQSIVSRKQDKVHPPQSIIPKREVNFVTYKIKRK